MRHVSYSHVTEVGLGQDAGPSLLTTLLSADVLSRRYTPHVTPLSDGNFGLNRIVLGLPKNGRRHNSIMVVVDRF